MHVEILSMGTRYSASKDGLRLHSNQTIPLLAFKLAREGHLLLVARISGFDRVADSPLSGRHTDFGAIGEVTVAAARINFSSLLRSDWVGHNRLQNQPQNRYCDFPQRTRDSGTVRIDECLFGQCFDRALGCQNSFGKRARLFSMLTEVALRHSRSWVAMLVEPPLLTPFLHRHHDLAKQLIYKSFLPDSGTLCATP